MQSEANISENKTGHPVIEARNLVRHFTLEGKGKIHAVNDVSLRVYAGETLALVGESGCGKSTLGRLLIGLDTPDQGQVILGGQNLAAFTVKELRLKRASMQMVFQDPATALDPRWTIEATVREPLDNFGIGEKSDRPRIVADLLHKVGLRPDHATRYPHELSGGQRQRVGIARALAPEPTLIVADEPVSALDVSVRAQVVNLLSDLRDEMGLGMLFISHDIGLVSHISDRIAVMYLGKIVEIGETSTVLNDPRHPYTRGLLDAVPKTHPSLRRQRKPLEGDPPSPLNLPEGCWFADRCPLVTDLCRTKRPDLLPLADGRNVACHFAVEVRT